MKVSVIVPVFNTGPAIEALIGSLRAQTLPSTRWEAVFVDDGSTDDTAARIERLIAAQPNMRLLREEPSGWPGRPRNVGMDAAIGDYVFFCDDDDTLGPAALERLTAFADAHGSDVVVPRMVGRNRGVPTVATTVVDAQDEPGLIMRSLTPQKLLRRAFLQEQGVRFMEGHYRLEDHLFVTTAYLRARRVSVYADYPCYFLAYQQGRPHISRQRPDWPAYFRSVRACLDRVDAEARDPEYARAMRGRWLRAETLARLRGAGYAKLGTPELIAEARQLLLDRYDVAELAVLSPIDRMLAALLLDDRLDEVAGLAAWEAALRVGSTATAARIEPDGTVRIELQSALAVDAEAPLPTIPADRPLYPTASELLAQASTFTDIGVELQHQRTKERRPAVVEHGPNGRAAAVLSPTEEPLSPGRWTVIALAGQHKTRRRQPVEVADRIRLAETARRVGPQTLRLLDTGRLVLRVSTSVPLAPVSVRERITRRVRRLVPSGPQLPHLSG